MSAVECVPPAPDPTTITGSTIVETVESTVIVVPWIVKFPEMTTLSLISTCPPVESKIRLPAEVETVLTEEPTVTEFTVILPEPIDKAFVLGLIVNVASEETATPAPEGLGDIKM